jgi:HEAT repeat protein
MLCLKPPGPTVLAALILCAGASQAAPTSRVDGAPTSVEPVYEGRPLNWWLTWWSTNCEGPMVSADGPLKPTADLSKCRPVLSTMGTSAIPFILQHVRDRDPAVTWSRQVADYFGYIGSNAVPQLAIAAEDRDPLVREAATLALLPFAGNVLSTNETARLFGKALEDTNEMVSENAAQALWTIRPAVSNCVPALIRALESCLTDTNKSDSWKHSMISGAALTLASIGPPAAAAYPVLTNLLPSAGFTGDLAVAAAIWRVSSNSDLTLPVLLDYGEFGYILAVDTLGEIGPKAKAAVPFLREFCTCTDPLRRSSASTALKHIDPEAAAQAGVK